MNLQRNLLWVDGIAGTSVGVLMIAVSGLLSPWYQLPYTLLMVMAVANLMYGCYSLTLARRKSRPRALIHLLVGANLGWALLCFVLAVVYWGDASVFGLIHLVGEGLFVGGLACVEWRWREHLIVA